MRPLKPDTCDGTREFLRVNNWLYTTNDYFTLIQESVKTRITDKKRVRYAAKLLTGTEATWWLNIMQMGRIVDTWSDFEQAVPKRFIPEDHERRAREKLRIICQNWTMATYVNAFSSISLKVPDLYEKEKWDCFFCWIEAHFGQRSLKIKVHDIWKCCSSRGESGGSASGEPLETENVRPGF